MSSSTRVFMDIGLDSKLIGRLIIKLYWDDLPRTSNNFFSLCTGEQNYASGPNKGKPLTYKGCIFHRLIKGFMLQGGDFTKGNGQGGLSIYGDKFEDEDFKYKHTKRGLLSMANAGPNTNGSQFFITFGKCEWIDGKHVVFGEIIEGLEMLDSLESIKVNQADRPSKIIRVIDCGEAPLEYQIPAPISGKIYNL